MEWNGNLNCSAVPLPAPTFSFSGEYPQSDRHWQQKLWQSTVGFFFPIKSAKSNK